MNLPPVQVIDLEFHYLSVGVGGERDVATARQVGTVMCGVLSKDPVAVVPDLCGTAPVDCGFSFTVMFQNVSPLVPRIPFAEPPVRTALGIHDIGAVNVMGESVA